MDYLLSFTPNEMMLLDKALGALPFREVAPLINKIMDQVRQQEKASEPVESTE